MVNLVLITDPPKPLFSNLSVFSVEKKQFSKSLKIVKLIQLKSSFLTVLNFSYLCKDHSNRHGVELLKCKAVKPIGVHLE